MLRYLTSGESHGKGLTAILEGMPSGLSVTADPINFQLARRQKGYGRGGRMKIETDTVEIMSGIRHGITLGSPISLWVANKDWRSWQHEMSIEPPGKDFESRKKVECPRPGHADLAGSLKYHQTDLRNILERASARETTIRVAVGAIARIFLEEFNIHIAGHVTTLGGVNSQAQLSSIKEIKNITEENELRCLDPEASQKMKAKIDEAKKKGDSLGGIFEIIVDGLPPGLGSHVQWDRKLDSRLAAAILSIQAIKGVEFGKGFELGHCFGSQAHDDIFYNKKTKRFTHKTNRAGGLEGGMTNGERIILKAVMKPIATLYTPLHSVHIDSKKDIEASVERSDTCAVPAASVIAENVIAIELANAFLEKFGGDSLEEIKRNYQGYQKYLDDF